MQTIKELIEKYKVDVADKEVTYMIIQDLLANRTNFDFIGKEMLDNEKYSVDIESGVSVDEQYRAYGLTEQEIDPLFVFIGECDGDYIYAVTDRKIYVDADGKISKPIIQQFNLVDCDPNTNKYYCRPDVTYVAAKIIEELPYLEKTGTDMVSGVGTLMEGKDLNVYNDNSYDRMVNHRIAIYPCGEDESKIYAYVVFIGDLVITKDAGPEPVYGMYLLTTGDGRVILITQDKADAVPKESDKEEVKEEV